MVDAWLAVWLVFLQRGYCCLVFYWVAGGSPGTAPAGVTNFNHSTPAPAVGRAQEDPR